MPDAVSLLNTAADRGDSTYLAIATMILCGLMMAGMGYLQLKLWRELREDIRTERTRTRKAMEAISITNLCIQQTLGVISLTMKKEGPETAEDCREYHKRAEAIFRIQDEQRTALEKAMS